MSTRSMLRPSTRNRQPSSWLIVDSASPANSAARSFTNWKNACGPTRLDGPDLRRAARATSR